jgi:hypothetical protein
MRKFFYATTFLVTLASSFTQAQSLTQIWSLSGFSNPESTTWDDGTNQIFVSQMGRFGPEGGQDGKLSIVSINGSMIKENWVTGLVDPKGMVSSKGKLYVVDATGIVVIDIPKGIVLEVISIPGAVLLNDIAITQDGTLFATDLAGNAIFKIRNGVASYLLKPGRALLPNGIMAYNGTLIVGSFGEGQLHSDFTVDVPGGLLTVDTTSGAAEPIKSTIRQASVDGITLLNEEVLFADNPTGRILSLKDGKLNVVATLDPGIADIGATLDLLLVPNSAKGTVTAYHP